MASKKRFEELKQEAWDEGNNDTLADEIIGEHALLWLDEVEDTITDAQRDELIEQYYQGFKAGI